MSAQQDTSTARSRDGLTRLAWDLIADDILKHQEDYQALLAELRAELAAADFMPAGYTPDAGDRRDF
jgi:hypothetical protein